MGNKVSWNPNLCVTQLKMCQGRAKLHQQKLAKDLKKTEKEIATLLGEEKVDKARAKCEHLIQLKNEDLALDLLDAELVRLQVRVKVLDHEKQFPEDLIPVLANVLFCEKRLDLQELGEFKMQIGAKFGKQFLTETQDGKEETRWESAKLPATVDPRLEELLRIAPPEPADLEETLVKIAGENGVAYTPPAGTVPAGSVPDLMTYDQLLPTVPTSTPGSAPPPASGPPPGGALPPPSSGPAPGPPPAFSPPPDVKPGGYAGAVSAPADEPINAPAPGNEPAAAPAAKESEIDDIMARFNKLRET